MADTPPEVPAYQVPYQFGAVEQDDTYHMAVNVYLSDVLQRVQTGHSLRDVIRADVRQSLQWHKETYPERKDT